MDMTNAIAPRSDQMNAEDLLSGPRTFTITEVRQGSSAEQPVSVYLAEFPQDRPFKPSKTVRRIMVAAWGKESDAYVGHRMTLYCDTTVTFGKDVVGGIRVSHMSHIGKRLSKPLATSRGKRAVFVVEPLPDEPAPTPQGPPLTLDMLVAAFKVVGVESKESMLAYCRNLVRPDLASASDLTGAEAARVYEALKADAAEPEQPALGEDGA